jgi:uncharacterized protein (TIGR03067 family)
MLCHALVLCLTALLPAPDTAVDEAKKELERIQGTWVATRIEINGRPTNLGGSKLICTGDQYVQMAGDQEVVERGTHKLDPTKKPKHMDITITGGEQKGLTQLGIYELEGDTLKMCVSEAGSKERPKDFSTKPGTGQIFVTFKREKKDK